MIKLFEKLFKTVFVLAVWLFIAVATAAVLPDSAWERFPEKLTFVREFLAEKNIISSQFRKDANGWAESGNFVNPVDKLATQPPVPASDGLPHFTPEDLNGNAELPPVDVVPNLAESRQEMPPATPPAFPTVAPNSLDSSNILDSSNVSNPDSIASLPEIPAFKPSSATAETTAVEASPAPMGIASTSVSDVPEAPAEFPTFPSNDPIVVRANDTIATDTIAADSPAPAADAIPPFPALTPLDSTSSHDTLPNLNFEQSSTPAGPGTQDSIASKTTAPQPVAITAFPEPGTPTPLDASPLISTVVPVPDQEQNHTQPAGFTSETPAQAGILPEFAATSPESSSALAAATPATSPLETGPHDQLLALIEQSKDANQVKDSFFKLNQILIQNKEQLSSDDLQLLHENLDRLAFTVFYDGRQHVLEPEYIVGQSESLSSIAAAYKVTPQLLGVLNSLDYPADQPLPPGTHLKVVRGPVTASVSMNEKELTLLFDGLYAGRFKMGCCAAAKNLRGVVSITRKVQNPQYNGPLDNGQWGSIPGGDATNPLGGFWIELNNGLGLQGTNHPEYIGSDVSVAGGLIFSNKDINHLNILLPTGASVHLCD